MKKHCLFLRRIRTHAFFTGTRRKRHNDYFDISTSVLQSRPILFEDEWRYIDYIEDADENPNN